tara:strand:+ start:12981 stop:13226 length:246 start_codon:yes stop_codon:yes gene_type:complete
MKRLLINGDIDLQKGTKIEYEEQELVCFSVTRNGDYHGPRRVQLSCIVGEIQEYSTFIEEEYIPHFLETESIDSEDVKIAI